MLESDWTRESIKASSRCRALFEIFKLPSKFGVPYGSRTRVAAVKGRCPRPLDERDASAEDCQCGKRIKLSYEFASVKRVTFTLELTELGLA